MFKNKNLILTPELNKVLNILENTRDSIFITGKAGTGKSTLLKHFSSQTDKNIAVLAPTGVAALNVGGQTIHSFFRFPPAIINPATIQVDPAREDFFEKLETVIIDEVSMVRSDVMNGIDVSLRRNRLRPNEPFGGVQMIFIGDLFQLPPVLRSNERKQILGAYGGQYFFDAPVFSEFKYHFKELTQVFRQSKEQKQFKDILNAVRNNEVTSNDLELLNSRHIHHVTKHKNALFLTTRRNIAKSINTEKLADLRGKEQEFVADLSGKYKRLVELGEDKLDNKFPAPYKLALKKNAQVMMLKNDLRKRWVNGSIGTVDKILGDSVVVKIDGKKFVVERETWSEVKYGLNSETDSVEGETTASFTQFPMRLSYAITIHKSQGKTFDNVVIDVGSGAFAHGQVYVALSRCKTLEGIALNNEIRSRDIIVDPRIIEYHSAFIKPRATRKQEKCNADIRSILRQAIENKNKIRIKYKKHNGKITLRDLSEVRTPGGFGKLGRENKHIGAFCHLRNERRNFVIERIVEVSIAER